MICSTADGRLLRFSGIDPEQEVFENIKEGIAESLANGSPCSRYRRGCPYGFWIRDIHSSDYAIR